MSPYARLCMSETYLHHLVLASLRKECVGVASRQRTVC
jgi:hypothetical protein